MKINLRKKLLQKELKRMVTVLKEKYHPQKIILFGSFADGELKEWSDIDILIVKNTHQRLIDRIGKVIDICNPKIATDFIVYTPLEFRQLSKIEPFVQKEIVEKGKVLYEQK